MIRYDADDKLRIAPSRCVAKPVVINVGPINTDYAAAFREELDRAAHTGQPLIPIVIDSDGGEIYALLAMVDAIESVRPTHNIATIVHGRALSCGAVLLAMGDPGLRFVSPNATVMVHDAWDAAHGKTGVLESAVRETRRLDDLTNRLMDRGCGQPDGYWSKVIHERAHAEVYLSPEECIEHKIANHIGLPRLTVGIAVTYGFELPEIAPPAQARGRGRGKAKGIKKARRAQ